MLDTMYAAPGVGLAAPQVGVSRRLIVLDCSPKDSDRHPLVAEMQRWGKQFVSGRLQVLRLPRHYDFRTLRLTPAETRAQLVAFERPNVAAFQPDQLSDTPVLPIGDVETSYYLRMRVVDRPGVLADITRILADCHISIDAMVQKEPPEGERQVDIVMLTHQALERDVERATAKLERLKTVLGKIVRLRLEALL